MKHYLKDLDQLLNSLYLKIKKEKNENVRTFRKSMKNTLKTISSSKDEAKLRKSLIRLNNSIEGDFGDIYSSIIEDIKKLHNKIRSLLFKHLDKELDGELKKIKNKFKKDFQHLQKEEKENYNQLLLNLKEHISFQHAGLFPQWLITKHLKPRANIFFIKRKFTATLMKKFHKKDKPSLNTTQILRDRRLFSRQTIKKDEFKKMTTSKQ